MASRACSKRGRGALFALTLLVQVVPFQLLMVPLYVLIARDYGLPDNYLGIMLPFVINSTAVIIFRQYFLQLPRALFEAARIDGAPELQVLARIALPLIRPALVTVVLAAPVVVLFVSFQRWFVASEIDSGVKG